MDTIKTSEEINRDRRRFFGTAAMTIAAGDANGAPHPDPSAYAKKFSGKYEHRNIEGGTGHNLPQEAPHAFAEAIVDVAEI